MLFSDISFEHYLLVAAVAFGASVFGGVTGYGAGLLLPPVLLPIIGPHAIVPVIALSALFTNGSRLLAFRQDFDRRRAIVVVAAALPACLLGAYIYTRLSGAGITLLIGLMLIMMVPLRRLFRRMRGHLGTRGLVIASGGYGLLNGGMSGVGVMLISVLLASGLNGTAVIATDAAISLVLGVAKVGVFQTNGYLPLSSWLMALLIGVCATPGAFLAKRLLRHLPGDAHVVLLDGVVVLGGLLMMAKGLGFY